MPNRPTTRAAREAVRKKDGRGRFCVAESPLVPYNTRLRADQVEMLRAIPDRGAAEWLRAAIDAAIARGDP